MAGTMLEHMKDRFGGKVEELSVTPSFPTSLNIELNNTCNQKCAFCYVHGPYAKKFDLHVMEFGLAKEIMKQAAELGIGSKEIGFYCMGEVFLYKQFPEIIEYAKELGFQYTFVTTNGMLGTPDVMKRVVDAGLDSIRFSVNAANREEYKEIHGVDGFEQVIENIQFLARYKKENKKSISTSVSCVITKKNQSYIVAQIKAIFGELVDQIVFLPVSTPRDRMEKDLTGEYGIIDDDSAVNQKHICPIPFNTMYIDSNGRAFLCCQIYEKNMRYYDLKEKLDLKEAWYSLEMQKYRQAFVNDDTTGLVCETCPLRVQGAQREFVEL